MRTKFKNFNNKYFLFLYLFTLIIKLSLTQNTTSNITCENLSKVITQDTSELISYIKTNINSLKTHSHSCIDALVKFCKTSALDFYLNLLSKHGIQYKENLEISLNTLMTQINDVYNKHKYSESQYQDVFPASRWAQNMNEIFIEVKFAHRHDSPGCLEMKNLKVELKERNIKLVRYCVLGEVPIKMNYNIKLFNKINVGESRHFESSVGRYQFNLVKKKKDNYWRRLLDEKSDIPTNMRVWFEMKEKYQDQIAKYEIDENDENVQNILETIEREEKKKERKSNKTKNKKKKKNKKKNKSTESDL
jgi:hypothetical protein